ncbi:hypothetical protein [Arthrobacter sp. B10-11]|uniref:hypothetical protein n=1 Tax=Arthrobacter sp. B10-11 TaxID=3081160 RepID=UPI002954E786|nr:hypothetical protein [Arthrobacter sp. B10-11]MDV8146264.1 hypothetical protein [Arthrobacter sp. B10-11]
MATKKAVERRAYNYDPLLSSLRGRVGLLSQSRGKFDPDLVEAKQEFRTETAKKRLTEIVNAWPPLTEEQIARIRGVLDSAKVMKPGMRGARKQEPGEAA